MGYIAVPASRTGDVKARNHQYVNVVDEKIASVDRRRQRHSSAVVAVRRRSVAVADRDRRPVSYRDLDRPQPADVVPQNGCRYTVDTPDGAKCTSY